MKKYVSLGVFSVLLLFSFVSCSPKGTSHVNTVSEQNTLKVGMDLKFPPFMYQDDQGRAQGLEPEIARSFGLYLGRDVEIVNTDFAMLLPALESGAVDIIISDMSVSEAREQKVDFSQPYRYAKTPILVNKVFYEKNHISDSMSAQEFFVIPHIQMVGLSGTVGTLIPAQYGVESREATEIGTGIMEVTTGSSDAIAGSYTLFGDYHAHQDTTALYLGIPDVVPSAFAVKKNNTALLSEANDFIDTLYEKGGLYDQLAEKFDPLIDAVFFTKDLGLSYITEK